jgi:hypothetical protein
VKAPWKSIRGDILAFGKNDIGRLFMKKKEKILPKKGGSTLLLNRKQVAGWFCFFFFTFIFMFVLGVFVGRGTAPVKFDVDKLQKELVALKEAVVQKEQFLLKAGKNDVKNRTDLGFYEVLKENKNDDRFKESLLADSSQPDLKPLLEKNVSRKNKQQVLNRVPAEKSKRTGIPENMNHGAALKNNPETEGNFTVQAASTKDHDYADKMVVELKKKGYPAYRTVATIPGKGVWYRVRIGCFKDRSEADDTINRLKKDNLNGMFVYR